MKNFIFIKGRTMWECQIYNVWIAIRFTKYWKNSGIGFIKIIKKNE